VEKKVELYECEEWSMLKSSPFLIKVNAKFKSCATAMPVKVQFRDKYGRLSVAPQQLKVPEGCEWVGQWKVQELEQYHQKNGGQWWNNIK
jgi:hypothetical protein